MKLKVGYCYNLHEDFPTKMDQPQDISIEWSDRSYVLALKEGLSSAGFDVIDIGEPVKLHDSKVRENVDVVFSIAEMIGYRYREILVPTICELYGLPYLFAKPDAMLITADKHLSNLFVQQLGLKVPEWHLVRSLAVDFQKMPNFPYIVKPNAEGSSMGITTQSVVRNTWQLKTQIEAVLRNYEQPAMVQKFVRGGEITVGVIQQNGKTKAMTPLQTFTSQEGQKMIFDQPTKRYFKENRKFVAVDNPSLSEQVKQEAVKIFDEIGCRDAARIDFRMKGDNLYFVEINGLTDFHPQSAFTKSAELSGIHYQELLREMVMNAWNTK